MLAQYLGVTTSYLLGEEIPALEIATKAPELPQHIEQLLESYNDLNEEGKEKATEYINDLVASGRYKKDSEFQLGEKKA